MIKPELSALELEIFNHRLEVPDAIEDYLTDSNLVSPDDSEKVYDICTALRQGKWDIAQNIDTEITALVVKDAVEGGTYLGSIEDSGLTRQKISAIRKAANNLAVKITSILDERVYYPQN